MKLRICHPNGVITVRYTWTGPCSPVPADELLASHLTTPVWQGTALLDLQEAWGPVEVWLEGVNYSGVNSLSWITCPASLKSPYTSSAKRTPRKSATLEMNPACSHWEVCPYLWLISEGEPIRRSGIRLLHTRPRAQQETKSCWDHRHHCASRPVSRICRCCQWRNTKSLLSM